MVLLHMHLNFVLGYNSAAIFYFAASLPYLSLNYCFWLV